MRYLVPYIGFLTHNFSILQINCALSSLPVASSLILNHSEYSRPSTRPLTGKGNTFVHRTDRFGLNYHTSTSRRMASDEEKAAIQAAKDFKSFDNDMAGPPTVFDKILSGEWSSKKVHEDELCLAFRDVSPQAPTHILVIPKHRDGLIKLS